MSVGKLGVQPGEDEGVTVLVQLTTAVVRSIAPLCNIWKPSFNQQYLRDLYVTLIKLKEQSELNSKQQHNLSAEKRFDHCIAI